MKLRKLRALRGQGSNVQQRPAAPTSVSADLDAIRGLFTEKEKELGMFSWRNLNTNTGYSDAECVFWNGLK